jgi:Fe-Mn family superoxide dismutase
MAFELPALPYPKNALEPHISERTMDFHHGRHHQAYVTNLNNLVKGSPAENQSLEELIKAAAVGQFGSGWAWLVADGGKLKITATPNAVNPLAEGQTALLTCDVWEHAYYLDFQNRRPDFVQTFLDHLVNWDFVAQNLSKAR